MAKSLSLQSSFNAGVLDPRLASRTDIEKYYSGLSRGLNVLCTPQGGIKRRPGMAFVYDVNLDGRLASFEFNVEQTYLFVFTDLQLRVFKDGVSQATVVTPWTLAQLPDLRWTQSADTMILVHEDHAPRKLVRGATHTSWTLSTISFKNIPQYNYDDASSPAATDEVQRVTISTGGTGVVTFRLDLEGETTSIITWSSGATATTAANIQAALRALPNTGASGITVAYVAASSPEAFDVTFSGDDGGIDWDIMTSLEITPLGVVTLSTQTDGEPSEEDIWSAGRGYPRSVTFHQGRLVFGGTKSKLQTILASVTNDFFNFYTGTGLDDQAIVATMDTDQVNAINDVTSSRHLQVFTSGGEFIEKSLPLTPSNVTLVNQTKYGSLSVKPVSIDGATMFIERRGKAIREFVYAFGEDAYTAAPVSLLAPHLIVSPVDMTQRKGTDVDDANLVYVVNSDGTMAVLNTLRSENIAGWTEWVTDGEILSVVSVLDDVYFLVKRTINAVTRYYLEQSDDDTYTDANLAKTQASSATITGLSHLNGESCRVKADGAVMADATPSGGSITMVRAGVDVEVGLDFDVIAATMPLNVNFANGATLMREKRVFHVQADLYESLGIIVNGKRLPDRTMAGPLPDIPDPYTGMKEVWLNGWSHLADVTVTQVDPLPMMVRSLSVDVEIG